MKYDRPILLSMAGFDPTGGAGVIADVKSFEKNGAVGMAVVTGITAQDENTVYGVNWVFEDKVLAQLEPLFANYNVQGVKIGMIQDFKTLLFWVKWLRSKSDAITIVWDPIKKSTSGTDFLKNDNIDCLKEVLENIDCITPNLPEYDWLNELVELKSMRNLCIYLKGGHKTENQGVDTLMQNGKQVDLQPNVDEYFDKHGTGCILSSALLANFIQTNDWDVAGKKAKYYLEKVTGSNANRLAYHEL